MQIILKNKKSVIRDTVLKQSAIQRTFLFLIDSVKMEILLCLGDKQIAKDKLIPQVLQCQYDVSVSLEHICALNIDCVLILSSVDIKTLI